jgi:hypothetical protein
MVVNKGATAITLARPSAGIIRDWINGLKEAEDKECGSCKKDGQGVATPILFVLGFPTT